MVEASLGLVANVSCWRVTGLLALFSDLTWALRWGMDENIFPQTGAIVS